MNTTQCRKCAYWKRLSGAGNSGYACHFLLEKRRSRHKDGEGRCMECKKLSKTSCKSGYRGDRLKTDQHY